MSKRKKKKIAIICHKWIGIFFTFFILIFAGSGIFLNHRQVLSTLDIPRSFLPKKYHYHNWNNGSVKGTLKITPDSILLFGGNGIWLTDSKLSYFKPFNKGIKKGADNQTTKNIIKTTNKELFAVTTFDFYQYDYKNDNWKNISDRLNTQERLTDLSYHKDTLILLSRSHAYKGIDPFSRFDKITLKTPQKHQPKISLFKTLWTFHSGELFGLIGKLMVDFLGIITIILCFTGIIIFFSPRVIKNKKHKKQSTYTFVTLFKSALKWHNKPGVSLFVLLIILCLSGMFLRPPLLISIIKTKHSPLSFTTQDKNNPFQDKLRCIRYDEFNDEWIIYTSEGFYTYQVIKGTAQKVKNTPPISVMGLEVFQSSDSTTWLTGSFSGLYYWNRQTGESLDYFTGQIPKSPVIGPPIISNPITGYSSDFEKEITFNYFEGVHSQMKIPVMPSEFQKGRISLWHASLEAHTGRIYTFFPDLLVSLFIPIAGLVFLAILISGYIIYRRKNRK